MIKKIFPYMKKYRVAAILCPIMMVLEVAADIVIPLLMERIVNVGIANHDTDYVIKTGLMMVAMAIFGGLMGTISAYFGAKAGYGTATELRNKAYARIQKYSFNNIDQLSESSLITRLTSDADTVGMVTMMSLRLAFRAPFLFFFALFFSYQVDSELATIFFVAVPIIIAALVFLFRKVMPLITKMRKKIDAVNGVIQEQLGGIRVIKSFNRQDYSHESFEEKNTSLRDLSLYMVRYMVLLSPLMIGMIYVCIIAILWIGGNRILNGTMQAGTIIAFLTYVGQIMISLMFLSMYIINLSYGLASLRRIFEVIDTSSEIEDPASPVTTLSDSSIEFRDVCFKYPGYRDYILKNINLRFEPGSRVGIIGSTGSSKSTLVQMIPRLYDVDEGEVIVGGHNVKEYDTEYLRDAIAMVLQKNILVSGTIRSNMQWGNPNASDEEIIQALKNAQAWEFVSKYSDTIDHMVEQEGSNFSGGQKQRLTIARALLKKPKILILDDSTSAVDTDTDSKIRRMIREELPGVTTIIIAQRIDSIRDADQIVVMEEGSVESVGTHEELIERSEIYREINSSQEGGLE